MDVIRGDLWTAAGGGDYLHKPRPTLILQADRFAATESITVCPLTSDMGLSAEFRIVVEPSERNGLDSRSAAMVDKINTVKRSRLGHRIGHLDAGDMALVEVAVAEFLGISRGSA
jgi:mRNA interferase MazF